MLAVQQRRRVCGSGWGWEKWRCSVVQCRNTGSKVLRALEGEGGAGGSCVCGDSCRGVPRHMTLARCGYMGGGGGMEGSEGVLKAARLAGLPLRLVTGSAVLVMLQR